MSINYKPLFEIKLMHEYFLTTREGSVIFEKSTQPERLHFLQKEFTEGNISVNEIVGFEFPSHLKAVYESYNLKLLPTYSGCKVVTRVSQQKLNDQSVLYKPFTPFPVDLSIFISIVRKHDNINVYTNERIRRPLSSSYFFSNLDLLNEKTFPFLTNSVPVKNNLKEYEQGELALSSSNTIKGFYRQGGTDKWIDVKGSGFINESDRMLLPEKFEYSFENDASLTSARFVLRDSNGQEIVNETKAITGSKPSLDLSKKIKPIDLVTPPLPDPPMYTLEVKGNNGFSEKHFMLFSSQLYSVQPWATIHIRTKATNTAFNLFAPDGFLITRKDAFGVSAPAPIFEIPVKSRLAYWRFVNNKGRELTISPALADYVDKEGSVLVTKEPRTLARNWFHLLKQSPPGSVYVPNPVSYDLRIEDDRRIFYNVNVPQSVLFPVA